MKHTILTLAALLLAPLATLPAAESSAPQKPRTQFLPDQTWPDDNGVPINAHGGGVQRSQRRQQQGGEKCGDRVFHNAECWVGLGHLSLVCLWS